MKFLFIFSRIASVCFLFCSMCYGLALFSIEVLQFVFPIMYYFVCPLLLIIISVLAISHISDLKRPAMCIIGAASLSIVCFVMSSLSQFVPKDSLMTYTLLRSLVSLVQEIFVFVAFWGLAKKLPKKNVMRWLAIAISLVSLWKMVDSWAFNIANIMVFGKMATATAELVLMVANVQRLIECFILGLFLLFLPKLQKTCKEPQCLSVNG